MIIKLNENHMVALMKQLEQDLERLQTMENTCVQLSKDDPERLEMEVVVVTTYAKIKESRSQLEAIGIRM